MTKPGFPYLDKPFIVDITALSRQQNITLNFARPDAHASKDILRFKMDLRTGLIEEVKASQKTVLPKTNVKFKHHYQNEHGRIVAGSAVLTNAEPRNSSSSKVTGLLKALKVETDISSKKDKAKVYDELRVVFQGFLDEGLLTVPVPAPIHESLPSNDALAYEQGLGGEDPALVIFNSDEMRTGQVLAELLGIHERDLAKFRNERKLLGITIDGEEFRYPAWQLEPEVGSYVSELLHILPNRDRTGWEAFVFMTSENPILNDKSPLEALRSGDVARVHRAAEAYAFEMA
jgi:hypothetical protein